MPENRYTEDNFYKKGSFNVRFTVEPLADDWDEKSRQRALHQLLLALRDETNLKISSFIDVYPSAEEEDSDAKEEEGEKDATTAEFVVFNKLGVTSLGKLNRFMEAHLKGKEMQPRMVLIDPQTQQKYRATAFTIRYLFNDFVARRRPDDWDRLRELLKQEDRGYRELTQTKTGMLLYRGCLFKPVVL